MFFNHSQRLLDTLDKDEDKQKKRLSEMTRKITVLRVNEKSLSRRYTAMQEVEAALRKENKKYKNDVVAMETAITERLGYLQRHKVCNICSFKYSGFPICQTLDLLNFSITS